MQRHKSNNRNGRLANTEEKAFHKWLKQHGCCWCNKPGPTIMDHARGQTFGHNKVHIGHWFGLCPCEECDTEKTIHGKRFGNESEKWLELEAEYFIETGKKAPDDVHDAIEDWNR